MPLRREFARPSTTDHPSNFLVSFREDALAHLDRFKDRIPRLFGNYCGSTTSTATRARGDERPLAVWRELGEEGPGEAAPDLVERCSARSRRAGFGPARRGRAPRERRAADPDADLQLVLARLWDEELHAGSPLLRLATLERLGGAERIVATHLDAAMDTLGRREQAVAAEVFRYLVTPSGMKMPRAAPIWPPMPSSRNRGRAGARPAHGWDPHPPGRRRVALRDLPRRAGRPDPRVAASLAAA